MASSEIEQFRRHGLGSPICIKPGLRSYLFLLFAGPLLIGGSVLALAKGGPLTFLAGLIGLPLSAFACLLYLQAGRAMIFRHTPSPWRAIIFQALGLQGPNGLKTLEPRVR
jgi:hypothetical protein